MTLARPCLLMRHRTHGAAIDEKWTINARVWCVFGVRLHALLRACTPLYSDLLGDPAIYLAFPIKLLLGKIGFEARLNQEIVFTVEDETQLSPMLNNVNLPDRLPH